MTKKVYCDLNENPDERLFEKHSNARSGHIDASDNDEMDVNDLENDEGDESWPDLDLFDGNEVLEDFFGEPSADDIDENAEDGWNNIGRIDGNDLLENLIAHDESLANVDLDYGQESLENFFTGELNQKRTNENDRIDDLVCDRSDKMENLFENLVEMQAENCTENVGGMQLEDDDRDNDVIFHFESWSGSLAMELCKRIFQFILAESLFYKIFQKI